MPLVTVGASWTHLRLRVEPGAVDFKYLFSEIEKVGILSLLFRFSENLALTGTDFGPCHQA